MRYTTMRHLILISLLACGLATAVPTPGAAGERDGGLEDGPGHGVQIRFRSADGGSFRPRELVVMLPGGALRAPLPESGDVRNENRVNVRDVPLVGTYFPDTLSPDDARDGTLVGPVYRRGDRLLLDASDFAEARALTAKPVVLSSNLPRLGTLSFTFGQLPFVPGGGVLRGDGPPIGGAYLVQDKLVIAARGGEPAWPTVERLFQDIFN